jgi:hypothetical protein
MTKRFHSIGSPSGSKRSVAFIALVVFSVQLVRFYVVVPRDAFTCSELGHHHAAGEFAEALEHAGGAFLPPGGANQNYFQHCKETLDGLCLTPAQPLGMPVFATHRIESPIWLALPNRIALPVDNALPPPFQPPRNFA